MKFSGEGNVDSRCVGVGADDFLTPVPFEKDGKRRDRARAAAPAFLVRDIVDMVVWARPERVMSTMLLLLNSPEFRLGGAARGRTSEE